MTDYELLELLRYVAQALGIRGKDDGETLAALRRFVLSHTGVNLKAKP